TVQGIDGELFEDAIDKIKAARGVVDDLDLNVDDVQELVERFKAIVHEQTGEPFPSDPREQMTLAIKAVFDSWNAPRAELYRRQERIPAEHGPAANISPMVFATPGMDSGSGAAFTRDPRSGRQAG